MILRGFRTQVTRVVLACLIAVFSFGTLAAVSITAQTEEAWAAAVLTWPVPGHKQLSQGFHDGNAIDINDANITGATVVAAYGGQVKYIYKCGIQHYGSTNYNGCGCNGFGTGLVIYGNDGRWYQYAHMQAGSIPGDVYYGATIYQGQKLGTVGKTGNATGPHLHFAISKNKYWTADGINPLNEQYKDDNPPPDPGPTWTDTVNSVTTDNLGVKGKITFSSKRQFTKAGFQIWDSDGNLMKNFSENTSYNASYLEIFYNSVKDEVGVTLKPGTVYTYQYYAVADGQTYYSPKYTKQTNWPAVQNIGEDFYGFIMNDAWNPLQVEANNNVVVGKETAGTFSRTIWHFKRNSDGSYTITSLENGKALEVNNATDANDANVGVYPTNGAACQKWYIYSADGKYIFRPGCSSTRVLDVNHGAGANMAIWPNHNTSNERFSVYKIQDQTSYSIRSDKSEIMTGENAQISINDTKYAYDYKLHIVKPDGSEKLVENGEKNTYTFTETAPGTYKIYAEVKGPLNTAKGSASDRSCIIKVKSAVQEETGRFSDVKKSDWYYNAVEWAAKNGIATGSNGKFYPKQACTREEAITFIWRMQGKPNPKSTKSKFSDVKNKNRYSYKAIMWGTEKGIITGKNGKFYPKKNCTREQIVAMLWRLTGCPNPKNLDSKFSDVKNKKSYSYKAILWAYHNKLTTGSNGKFYPSSSCKRCDIITFIYRYMN